MKDGLYVKGKATSCSAERENKMNWNHSIKQTHEIRREDFACYYNSSGLYVTVHLGGG